MKVSVDPDLEGLVHKSLADELRRLPGVLVTDASPEYTVSVIALKVVNQSRRKVGTTFSVLITQPYTDSIRQFSQLHLEPGLSEQLAARLSGAVKLIAHWVEIASANDIPAVCRSIIQSFEREALHDRQKPAAPSAEPAGARFVARAHVRPQHLMEAKGIVATPVPSRAPNAEQR